MTKTKSKIRPRVRDAILQSLAAGVVPRVGQQHIQVGRKDEVQAMMKDIARIKDVGSSARFVIGRYGSGKTFFLQLVRSIALSEKLVTAHADLTPDRRIHASGGQARALYQELMRNLSTRAKPDGKALASVVERFISSALKEAEVERRDAEEVIKSRLDALREDVGGFAFAEVIAAYWRGHDTGDGLLKQNALRWLRAEFANKTEARRALGVRTIIEDKNVYDMLKLFARFVRLAGFGGLLVCLDEMVNLYKLGSGRARRSNYEQLLRILNDSLQGGARGIGFVFGGTPEFLLDPRKGLYSYEALQTRLAQNSFARDGLRDLSGPVLTLESLSPEDLYVLLQNVRDVHASGEEASALPDEALTAFMKHCSETIGDAYFKTPRNTVVAFVSLLAVLAQNPDARWRSLIGGVAVSGEASASLLPTPPMTAGSTGGSDELASFTL